VILDTAGAEKLLSRGDMLYMAPDSSKLARLQGCFVSDVEAQRLADFWREKIDWQMPQEGSAVPGKTWNHLTKERMSCWRRQLPWRRDAKPSPHHSCSAACGSAISRGLPDGHPGETRDRGTGGERWQVQTVLVSGESMDSEAASEDNEE